MCEVQYAERAVDDRQARGDQREQRTEHEPVEALRNEICPVDHSARLEIEGYAAPSAPPRHRDFATKERWPVGPTAGGERAFLLIRLGEAGMEMPSPKMRSEKAGPNCQV